MDELSDFSCADDEARWSLVFGTWGLCSTSRCTRCKLEIIGDPETIEQNRMNFRKVVGVILGKSWSAANKNFVLGYTFVSDGGELELDYSNEIDHSDIE